MRICLQFASALIVSACSSPQSSTPTQNPESGSPVASYSVVLYSQVTWEKLNPARGDQSPQAATVWGDRNGRGPTGFLFRPVDGFRSPPHIHNVSYRGVVIRGEVHNDDPNAEEMWMPAGAFWTQPKGAVHITAAKGTDTLAYIEIDDGPYLVRPVEQAFETEERPINVDPSNIVWLDQPEMLAGGAKVAFLWGNPHDAQPSGALVKLRAGSSATLRGVGPSLHAVVIQEATTHQAVGSDLKTLEPGSYFRAIGASSHELSCEAKNDCIIYLRVEGPFKLNGAAK